MSLDDGDGIMYFDNGESIMYLDNGESTLNEESTKSWKKTFSGIRSKKPYLEVFTQNVSTHCRATNPGRGSRLNKGLIYCVIQDLYLIRVFFDFSVRLGPDI